LKTNFIPRAANGLCLSRWTGTKTRPRGKMKRRWDAGPERVEIQRGGNIEQRKKERHRKKESSRGMDLGNWPKKEKKMRKETEG